MKEKFEEEELKMEEKKDFRKYDDPNLAMKIDLNYDPYPKNMPEYKRGMFLRLNLIIFKIQK